MHVSATGVCSVCPYVCTGMSQVLGGASKGIGLHTLSLKCCLHGPGSHPAPSGLQCLHQTPQVRAPFSTALGGLPRSALLGLAHHARSPLHPEAARRLLVAGFTASHPMDNNYLQVMQSCGGTEGHAPALDLSFLSCYVKDTSTADTDHGGR